MLREFPSKGRMQQQGETSCYQSYRLLDWLTVVPAMANDAAPAQLITLTLFTNGVTQKWPGEK